MNKKVIKTLFLFSSFIFGLNNKSRYNDSTNIEFVQNAKFVNSKLRLHDEIELNKIDNFKYSFISNEKFNLPHKDEFEGKNVENGIHSESISYKEDGSKIINKNEGSSSLISTYAFNDCFEDNDSFANATNMYHAGQDKTGVYIHSVWCQATISQKKTGWWLWEKTYIDKDFYSFDMVSTGTLEVTLSNIPTNCDYDLRLFKLEDSPSANCNNLSFDNYIGLSASLKSTETIKINATPGTYYACVYSFHDKTFDNDNPYTIKFEESVNTSRKGSYYNINSGRNNGDVGAVWLSDYKPLGYSPVTIRNSNSKKKVTNYDTYPYIKGLADTYNSKESYINYAVLYVWDVETRAMISALAEALVKVVDSQTDWDSNKEKSINIGMNTTSLILTVAGYVVGTISLIVTAGTAAAVLAGLGIVINAAALPMSLASFAMCFQSGSNFISSKKDLLSYLISVQQTFSVGKGSNNNEVKMIRYRYRFEREDNDLYLNWSPFYVASDYNFYNNDYITYQNKNSGIDGLVKGFSSYDEIKSILER